MLEGFSLRRSHGGGVVRSLRPCSDSSASPSFPSQPEGKIGNTGGIGDLGSIPRSGRSPGEGNSYPLQYSCLENPLDRGAWQASVHGVTECLHQLFFADVGSLVAASETLVPRPGMEPGPTVEHGALTLGLAGKSRALRSAVRSPRPPPLRHSPALKIGNYQSILSLR